MKTYLDHIAVAAPDLASGARFVEHALGVRLQPGGVHSRMGTHNLLLRLGDDVYLEVIAPDPAAPQPGRPRWFELDRLAPASPPRVATWVARTDDIAAARQACGMEVGEAEPMTRGALSWRITIPADGSLPGGGAAPTLIQWDGAAHPAAALDDVGCTLEGLDLFHPEPARIRGVLDAMGFTGKVDVHALPAGAASHLSVRVRTPYGLRTLPPGSGASPGY